LKGLHDEGWTIATLAPGRDKERADKAAATHLARVDRVTSAAKRQAFKLHNQQDRYRATHLGDQPPKLLQLCERVVAAETAGLGRSYYQLLSAVAHSRDHGLSTHMKVVDDKLPDALTGDGLAELGITSKEAALQTLGAPLALVTVIQEQALHRGWDLASVRPQLVRMLTVWGVEADVPYPRRHRSSD
jgi:hypothetical protein